MNEVAPVRIKQVILIRRDLRMRRGKEIAQGSHASMAFLTHQIRQHLVPGQPAGFGHSVQLSDEQRAWIEAGTAKVCLQVPSEEALLELHREALELGLTSHLIRDSGRTEFDGVPTLTACAIGPHEAGRIDAVTSELKLY